MTTQQQDRALRAILPPGWPGSLPEFLVFQELERLGKTPGIDFSYQAPREGGRLQKGGAVLDFLFSDPPDLAINVNGDYFHGSPEAQRQDKITRAQMAGQGLTVIFIDESDILVDVRRVVRLALRFQDVSRLGPGR